MTRRNPDGGHSHAREKTRVTRLCHQRWEAAARGWRTLCEVTVPAEPYLTIPTTWRVLEGDRIMVTTEPPGAGWERQRTELASVRR